MTEKAPKKNKKRKKYNSWFAVIFFSLLEMFTTTGGGDVGGDSVSLIDADFFLGEKGNKRKDKLDMALGVAFGVLLIVLGISIHQTVAITMIFIVLGLIIAIASIVFGRGTRKK